MKVEYIYFFLKKYVFHKLSQLRILFKDFVFKIVLLSLFLRISRFCRLGGSSNTTHRGWDWFETNPGGFQEISYLSALSFFQLFLFSSFKFFQHLSLHDFLSFFDTSQNLGFDFITSALKFLLNAFGNKILNTFIGFFLYGLLFGIFLSSTKWRQKNIKKKRNSCFKNRNRFFGVPESE